MHSNPLKQSLQDGALDVVVVLDAVLLGVAKAEWKAKLHELVDSLECDFEEKTAPAEALPPEGKR